MLARRFIFFVLASIVLVGCEKEITYEYLMTHPKFLLYQLSVCEKNLSLQGGDNEKNLASQCQVVMKARENFLLIAREQQQDPEAFGKKILQTEFDLANIKNQLLQAKQNEMLLKSKPQTPARELQDAQTSVNKITMRYQQKQFELKILLAVVGLNSPE